MKLLWFFLSTLALLFIHHIQHGESARILSISFTSSKSHKIVYTPLLEKLAERGHQITVVSPIKDDKVRPNFRNIHTFDSEALAKDKLPPNMFEAKEAVASSFLATYLGNNFLQFGDWMVEGCRLGFQLPHVRALFEEKFDLVLFPPLFNDCIYGLIHKLNTSSILIAQTAVMPWYSGTFGSPTLPSFQPLIFYGMPEEMNFIQRIGNFLGVLYYQTVFRNIYIPKMEQSYRDFISPDIPSISEIQANASLMLINSHISFAPARPLLPDLVEVGGMHLRPAKPLPKDLEDYFNGSGDAGFIYFSMGSFLQASTMPDRYRKIFLGAFSKLKQRVIWKWETETMEGLPKNVKLSKWLPQQDIMGHKKIRLFITHGGFGGTTEALYEGVPLLGLPMFGDQFSNMKQAVNLGIALSLDFTQLTESSLLNAINRILNEPQFAEQAKKRKEIFRDQIDNPLDRAIYWVEYVLRHGGATHMRSAARKLNFVQYYSLDVIATLISILLSILLVNFLILRAVLRKLFGGGSSKTTQKSGSSKSTKNKKVQ